jgi:hypothetical protein
MWLLLVLKSRRLLHINFFFKKAMEEGILDIQLAQCPSLRDC